MTLNDDGYYNEVFPLFPLILSFSLIFFTSVQRASVVLKKQFSQHFLQFNGKLFFIISLAVFLQEAEHFNCEVELTKHGLKCRLLRYINKIQPLPEIEIGNFLVILICI